jgi:hypothetical protein
LEEPRLQIALKIGARTVYAQDRLPAEAATAVEGEVGQEAFRQHFAAFQAAASVRVEDAVVADDEQLKGAGVFVVGKNANRTYVSFAIGAGNLFVAELVQTGTAFAVNVKAASNALFRVIEGSARALFAQK